MSIAEPAPPQVDAERARPPFGEAKSAATRASTRTTETPVIEVIDLVKVYGKGDKATRAVDGVTFDVAPGHALRLARAQWRREDDDDPGPGHASRCHERHGAGRGAGRRAASHTRSVVGSASPSRRVALDAFSTGRETLELAGRMHRLPIVEIRRRADELLELMTLTKVAGKMTGTYSGGMKRRLDLASALMHQPQLLILDEPTEGLDPQSRTALWEELERISKAGTTHAPDDALHGGGRPSLRPPGHHRQREDRRGGLACRAEAGHRRGHGRARAPGPCRRAQCRAGPRLARRARWRADAVAAHPSGVSLSVRNAGSAIPAVLRSLESHGVQIAGLHMSQPSLDDVFLRYTGRSIREEAADAYIPLGW